MKYKLNIEIFVWYCDYFIENKSKKFMKKIKNQVNIKEKLK
jgi:hypothetical protein